MKTAHTYTDGSRHYGERNEENERHGHGTMVFADGSRFVGSFEKGLFSGLGVMVFSDQSRWELMHWIVIFGYDRPSYWIVLLWG